jgi:isoleucyl-tRNA synthetase
MSQSPVFRKVPTDIEFPRIEEGILDLWRELDAFHESNRRRQGAEPFVFYDGPPFATGTPHYGHLLQSTVKDIVPRFWNMRGHPVERRFGWDCHGLPIEALAQEALGLHGTGEILEKGIDVFNEQCRSMVQTYVAEWRKTVTRLGRWIDFDDDYKTMDVEFMESVWWVFKQLWDQKRVYRSHRIMPYSWKLTTPLSNFEANSNYKEVQDPAITVRFRLTDGPQLPAPGYLLAWTTTPWTLPENLALCAGPDISYVGIRDSDAVHILAEARVGAYYKQDVEQLEVVWRGSGSDLAGWHYEPLFPYWAEQAKSFVVLTDDFVSTADGTGLVHMAPAYGEDDFRICSAAGIEMVDGLDNEARFTEAVPEYQGQFCKDADKALIRRLKDEGKLVHQATVNHSYPFCERTDTPLIYRAIEAWYVKVQDLRDRLVANNDTVNWQPTAVGSNRFGNWLREARDWNISRNRFWGSCIPVWVNVDDPDDCICVGSRQELAELSGVLVDDLHKHVVDHVVIERDGKTYRRTPEVLDCWFESGAMPYGQQHYPFARADKLEQFFPAHFIAEAMDQTRGWFYTLLIHGTALFDRAPYRNVVVTGMILAEDGKKMSKRLKNYPDPGLVLDRYGADALRAYLIDSPVVRGEELRFSEKGLKEIVRTVVIPYWNALSFFTTYAEVDGYDPRHWPAPLVDQRADADRWVLSVLQSLITDVCTEMEHYRLYNVVPRLVGFIDDLTNWYIRTNRRRFWKSEDDGDKAAAFATLYRVLVAFAKVLAPFMPFLTEAVYQRLMRPVDPQAPASVHWCDFPSVDQSLIDEQLERQVHVIRAAASLGRKIREGHKIKIRQPLAKVTIVHRDPAIKQAVLDGERELAQELNVKQVEWAGDEHHFCTITVKPNFKRLGKRCGPKLKQIGVELRTWGFDEVAQLEAGDALTVAEEALTLEDVLLQRETSTSAAMATDGFITVVLDTETTPALQREGLARDLVSAIQAARKAADLAVSDRIQLHWHSDSQEVHSAMAEHADSIATEVLATQIHAADSAQTESLTWNDQGITFAIEKR